MNDEIHAIKKNEMWELTNLPTNIRPMAVKWLYKTKYNSNGEIDYFKARLITNVFAPVARLDTIHMIISFSAQNNWKIYQMDVKYVFLNDILKQEVYVEQPQDM
ncbi:Copia protein, partial [Mucuna pruriens]